MKNKTKKQYTEEIEEALKNYETEEIKDLQFRIDNLTIAVRLAKEYNEIYKTPYKHPFMGKRIPYTESLISTFEDLIDKATIYKNNIKN